MSTKAIATSAKTGSTVTANVNGIETVINVARDLTVASGDGLLVNKEGSEWFAYQRYGTGLIPAPPSTLEPPPNPAPAVTYGSLVIAPVQTVSWNGTKWHEDTDDVIQGNYNSTGNHTGVAFYRDRARGVAGSVITDVKLNLKRLASGGSPAAQAITLWLITQNVKPAGAPTRQTSIAGPSLAWGIDTSFFLPNSWGQALVDGTAGGIGVYVAGGSPYLILSGMSRWSPTFTVTMTWVRNN